VGSSPAPPALLLLLLACCCWKQLFLYDLTGGHPTT
jgi:hypothetical protein